VENSQKSIDYTAKMYYNIYLMDVETIKKIVEEEQKQLRKRNFLEKRKQLDEWSKKTFWLLKRKGLFLQYRNYREYKKDKEL